MTSVTGHRGQISQSERLHLFLLLTSVLTRKPPKLKENTHCSPCWISLLQTSKRIQIRDIKRFNSRNTPSTPPQRHTPFLIFPRISYTHSITPSQVKSLLARYSRDTSVLTKRFRTESITKYTLTTTNTRWGKIQRVMAAKLTRLTHKIAI
jgi:hypothetical protein